MIGPHIDAQGATLALRGPGGPMPVLQGVSLHAAPGELVALVGPSGCGKSTLLAVLAGLLRPDAGRITLDGREGDRLGRLALMPQRDALLPWRTVEANAAAGAELAGTPRAAARRLARAVLARLGLGGFEDHYPHALSGGMRQRAALARTVLSRRGAWLLDEPFGALDAISREELQSVLVALHSEHRPTTVLVTHDLDEALALADRVIALSARPARVVRTLDVAAPRERPPHDPERVRARADLRGALAGSRP